MTEQQFHQKSDTLWRSISEHLEIAEDVPYTNPYAHNIKAKEGCTKSQLLKLSTNWGISHLGYRAPRAHKAIAGIAHNIKQPIISLLSTQWFPKAEPGVLNKYSLAIWNPDLLPRNSYPARLTIARQLDPTNYNRDTYPHGTIPYFNSITAEQADFTTLQKCQGIPIWTEQASTEAEFNRTLKKAHELISQQEELDILFALSKIVL